jgi:S1-C subfamily serine protease
VAPILEEEVERREPGRVFRGLQDVGRRLLPHAVAFQSDVIVPPDRSASDFGAPSAAPTARSGFGLPVSTEGDVLTHRRALGLPGRATAMTASGSMVPFVVTAYEPATGLVLVRLSEALPPPPAWASVAPALGELVMGAARAGGPDRVVPRFVASVEGDRYHLASGRLAAGMPIYNLAAQALGVADGAEDPVVFAVGPALDRLRTLRDRGQGLPSTLGMVLQPLDDRLARHLGPGVIVADLVAGGPAERAGVQPGDVLRAVGGEALQGVEDARRRIAALARTEDVEVSIARAGRERVVTLGPEVTLAEPGVPATVGATQGGPAAASVFSSDELAEAAIPPGARVLSVDGQPLTEAPLPRAARRRGAPWLVQLHHDGRAFFALVGEPRKQ